MKIGDRVAYDEENAARDDIHGTVAEPTDEERNSAHVCTGPPARPCSDVMVEWDDGERFWEDPTALVIVQEADS